MIRIDDHQYYRDEGPLPDLRVRDVLANTALIVGAGLALWFWNCVLAPIYFLFVHAYDTAAHAVNPARQVLYHGPFPTVVAPYAPYSSAAIAALCAYLAYRLCRTVARFISG